MICTRCNGTGFLNIDQVPKEVGTDPNAVQDWIEQTHTTRESLGGCSCFISPPCNYCLTQHDVTICDCCGNTEEWYGEPGEHDVKDYGRTGPYHYNGGLPECH